MDRFLADKKKTALAGCLVLAAIAGVLIWRCQYGFDWSDETYYTTLPYRFWLGDALFEDMWELHQLSAVLFYPLIKAYLAVTGGDTTGIMLFFRISFVVFQCLASCGTYLLFKRRWGALMALAAAAAAELFVHFALSNFSYDSVSLLLMILSFALAAGAAEGGRRRLELALSGGMYALAVQCYPQLAATLPVWAVYFILDVRRARREEASARAPAGMWFGLGVLAAAAAFAVFVAVNSSFSALRDNLSYILAEPSHPAKDAISSLKSYAGAIAVIFGPVSVGAAAVTASAAVASFLKPSPGRDRARGITLLAVLALMALAVARVACYDIEASVKINFLAMAWAPFYPALYLLGGRRNDPTGLLFFLGLGFSLAVQLSSNMGIYASSFPLLLCSLASTLYLPRLETGILRRPALALMALSAALWLASLGAFRILGVHRDAPLGEQTAVMHTGPGKGLRSTPENVALYEELMAAVRDNVPSQGSILTTSMFPFLYLCTELTPATPTVWYAPYDGRLEAYFNMRSDRVPSVIVTLPYGVGSSVGEENVEALLEQLKTLYGAAYRTVAQEHITFYIRAE